MKEVYTEIGIGNPTFINSQINEGQNEERVSGFVPMEFKHAYVRFYLGFIVLSWTFPFVWFRSHKNQIIFELGGFRITLKKKFKIKILFGLYGLGKGK